MEEVPQVITPLITNVGFPIACCVYMMVVNNKTVKENTEATKNLIDLIKTFIARMEIK